MGNVTFGVPEDLALELKTALNCETFIETGTYKGGTTEWAGKNFKRVFTVEFDKDRYTKTKSRIGNMIGTENITFLHGNSKEQLKNILNTVNEPVVFWLDAHGLGKLEETTTISDEIPLMDELATIFEWQKRTNQECAILIDDARLFLAPPPTEKGYHPEYWPSYFDICHTIDVGLGLYDDSYPDDKNKWIIEQSKDVIVVTPKHCEQIVLDWMKK